MGRPPKIEDKAQNPTLENKIAEPKVQEIKHKTVKCKVLAWERSISQHKAGDVVELEFSHAETLKAFNFVEFV